MHAQLHERRGLSVLSRVNKTRRLSVKNWADDLRVSSSVAERIRDGGIFGSSTILGSQSLGSRRSCRRERRADPVNSAPDLVRIGSPPSRHVRTSLSGHTTQATEG